MSVVQNKMKPTPSMLKLVRRLCTARRCLRCWQVREYVTFHAPSLGILTNQDTATARVLLDFIFLALRHFHCVFEHTEIQNLGLLICMLATGRDVTRFSWRFLDVALIAPNYSMHLGLYLQLFVRVLRFKTFLNEENSNTTKRLCTNYL
jgi:hypothetical protein